MTKVMIWNPIERLLWGIAIALLFVSATLYFYRAKKQENFNDKIILYGLVSIFIGLAFHRIFQFLSDFVIPGTYKNYTFYGDYSKTGSIYEFLTRLGYISWVVGITLFLLAFELRIKRTRYVFSIIQVFTLILLIIFPYNLMLDLYRIWAIYGTILLIIILFYFTKWSRFEFKAISALILLGMFLINTGWDLAHRDNKEINILPLIIPPIIFIIGTLIMISPIIINPKILSHALSFWVILGISIIVFLCILEFYYLYIGAAGFFLIYTALNLLVLIPCLYLTIKIVKSERASERKEETQAFLKIFAKPPKITEEEVTFHREKKICLVCKGKLQKYIFLCSNCDALYCEKCAQSLSNLENACWVCDTPFDESKPSKPFKKEEVDELKIEDIKDYKK